MQLTETVMHRGLFLGRVLETAKYQFDWPGLNRLHTLKSTSLEERLFRQLLAFSRLANQYGAVLEELNDPHFEMCLDEFRGDI